MGRRVAVTRPEDGAEELARLLRARGAVVVSRPLFRILAPADPAPLRRATAQLPDYDWVVFTSANAVRAVRDAMSCVTARVPRVAAVGTATAEAVTNELGWRVDVVPPTFTAAAITSAMQQQAPLNGARVLWPRASAARDALRRDLLDAGVQLHDPIAYRTATDTAMAEALAQQVRAGEVDAITFTSPSAIQCYTATSPSGRVVIAVIGPSTARAAHAAGLTVDVQPAEHTLPALVDALAAFFATV